MLRILAVFFVFSGALGVRTADAITTFELRPGTQAVFAGQPFGVDLYAVSSPSQPLGIVHAVIRWDPNQMTLIGHELDGAISWQSAGFPAGALNTTFADGDAFFQANVAPCFPVLATASGIRITTLVFTASTTPGVGQAHVANQFGGALTGAWNNLTLFGCGGQPVSVGVGASVSVTVEACVSGLHCVDGDACTADACSGGVCTYSANYNALADCCDPDSGMLTALSDGNSCTNDICNPATGMVIHTNKVAGSACGSPVQNTCTNPDTCDGTGTCLPNNSNDGNTCDDGDTCSQTSTCLGGVCVGGNPRPNGTSCTDGKHCTTGTGTCQGGKCVEPGLACGEPTPFCVEDPICTGGNECGAQGPCVSGRCAAGYVCQGCLQVPRVCATNADCPPTRACEDDVCMNCPPDVGCVTRYCSPFTNACVNQRHHDECQDGIFCNGDEVCDIFGFCQPAGSGMANCPVDTVCHESGDACVDCVMNGDCPAGMFCDVSDNTCVECLTNSHCNDGNPCNGIETCDLPLGQCIAGTSMTCPQNAICTINVCMPSTGLCGPVPAETVTCSAQNPCPTGFSCAPNGTCFALQACSDGNGCSVNDSCQNGTCVGQPIGSGGPVTLRIALESGGIVSVGQTVAVRFNATVSGSAQALNTIEANLQWDEVRLGLQTPGFVDPCTNHFSDPLNCPAGQYDWFSSGFLVNLDPDGLNDNFLDGDAHYTALIGLGKPDAPVSAGVPLWATSFRFTALSATSAAGTTISLSRCTGPVGTYSRATSGTGFDVTGPQISVNIQVRCASAAQCNDNNPCTVDSCNSTTQFCEYTPATDGITCGNQTPTGPCDLPDVCLAGACNANHIACPSDGNSCTDDVCDAAGQCTYPARPNGAACDDGLFCTLNETCTAAVCGNGLPRSCADSFPCTFDSCVEATDTCAHVAVSALCDDGQHCNGVETCSVTQGCVAGTPPDCASDGIACTQNDFCNESLNICDGVPNNALCPSGETCVAGLGCLETNCPPPLVSSAGPRYIAIVPQPVDGTAPMSLFLDSPSWSCLGKYVGMPVDVDADADGVVDGTLAKLVDAPEEAAVLTPAQWGGVVYVTGEDIAPTDESATGQGPLIESTYRVIADCGGELSAPATVTQAIWADADNNGVVNFTDVQLAILGFQGRFRQPAGSVPGSTRFSVNLVGIPQCDTEVPPVVNFIDVQRHVLAFQGVTYAQGVNALPPSDNCDLPCP